MKTEVDSLVCGKNHMKTEVDSIMCGKNHVKREVDSLWASCKQSQYEQICFISASLFKKYQKQGPPEFQKRSRQKQTTVPYYTSIKTVRIFGSEREGPKIQTLKHVKNCVPTTSGQICTIKLRFWRVEGNSVRQKLRFARNQGECAR